MPTIQVKIAHRTSSKLAFSWGYFDAAVTKAKGKNISPETGLRMRAYARDPMYANGYFAGMKYDGQTSAVRAKDAAWAEFLGILRDPWLLEKIRVNP